jgi:hypothetical protein
VGKEAKSGEDKYLRKIVSAIVENGRKSECKVEKGNTKKKKKN